MLSHLLNSVLAHYMQKALIYHKCHDMTGLWQRGIIAPGGINKVCHVPWYISVNHGSFSGFTEITMNLNNGFAQYSLWNMKKMKAIGSYKTHSDLLDWRWRYTLDIYLHNIYTPIPYINVNYSPLIHTVVYFNILFKYQHNISVYITS